MLERLAWERSLCGGITRVFDAHSGESGWIDLDVLLVMPHCQLLGEVRLGWFGCDVGHSIVARKLS